MPEITQNEVDSLGIHLYPLPPKVVWSLGAESVGFSCALTEPGSSASGLAPVKVPPPGPGHDSPFPRGFFLLEPKALASSPSHRGMSKDTLRGDETRPGE